MNLTHLCHSNAVLDVSDAPIRRRPEFLSYLFFLGLIATTFLV